MAESFTPTSFNVTHPQPVINITGDIDLNGYTVQSVEFLQQGYTTPIGWGSSDFQVNQAQPTHAMLKSTPSAHFGPNDDTVSGTLTITLSSGSPDDSLTISEQVTVSN